MPCFSRIVGSFFSILLKTAGIFQFPLTHLAYNIRSLDKLHETYDSPQKSCRVRSPEKQQPIIVKPKASSLHLELKI